jgi:ABC-type multidrug transport system ATPase subunit
MLDILATRIPHSQVTGDYLMNDKPVGGNFKRLSGYVMQDDALYPLLTVRETLQVCMCICVCVFRTFFV